MTMYEAKTRGVRVSVTPQFMETESSPQEGRFFWAYSVEIVNEADDTVQLVARHWRITDGDGQVHEVKGPGVVGEQPVLRAGESFTYTSGCPLGTAHGSMAGVYQMVASDGTTFEATIPAFPLQSPYARVTIH
jgi:ApaG protein